LPDKKARQHGLWEKGEQKRKTTKNGKKNSGKTNMGLKDERWTSKQMFPMARGKLRRCVAWMGRRTGEKKLGAAITTKTRGGRSRSSSLWRAKSKIRGNLKIRP